MRPARNSVTGKWGQKVKKESLFPHDVHNSCLMVTFTYITVTYPCVHFTLSVCLTFTFFHCNRLCWHIGIKGVFHCVAIPIILGLFYYSLPPGQPIVSQKGTWERSKQQWFNVHWNRFTKANSSNSADFQKTTDTVLCFRIRQPWRIASKRCEHQGQNESGNLEARASVSVQHCNWGDPDASYSHYPSTTPICHTGWRCSR